MQKKYFVCLSMLFLFCFSTISAVYAAGENTPQVSLSFDKSVFGFNETVPVRVAISNTGESDIKILRWLTPIDGVNGDLFSVSLDGKAVEYTGAVIKRAAPTEADYLIIKPGETIVQTVNLADYYDLSQSGYYQIIYRVESFAPFATQPVFQQKAERLESPSVSVWVYGTAKKTPAKISSPDYMTAGCNATQTAALPSAISGATNYAANSYNYLNAGTVSSRYTTWFGAFDSTRYSTARTHFLNIRNLLFADSYTIGCNSSSCKPSYYAFVFASDTTHTIYVCNQFWNAPTVGTDSKAGTLIHEISHFNDTASTNDYVYGQTAAKSLAISNPADAVNNADNHEYFAEAVAPTAAAATISGRVLSPYGRGVANATITLVSSAGATISTRATSSGYYYFDNIEAGQTYVLSANAKQFAFESKVMPINENLADIDLIAVSTVMRNRVK